MIRKEKIIERKKCDEYTKIYIFGILVYKSSCIFQDSLESDIARMFGYKNVLSYRNAKEGKKRLDAGIVELYKRMNS